MQGSISGKPAAPQGFQSKSIAWVYAYEFCPWLADAYFRGHYRIKNTFAQAFQCTLRTYIL